MRRGRPAADAGTTCLVLVVALAFSGCNSDQPRESYPEDLSCVVGIEFEAELGRLNDPISILSPMDHLNVVRTRDGRWIVVSTGMPQPFIYASDGSFGGVLGAVGEGPGEFLDPSWVSLDHSDSVWVSAGAGRILVLAPDGTHVRTLRTPGYAIDGFTPVNEPFSLLASVPGGAGLPLPYVLVRSRDLQPTGGLGPGLDDSAIDGRTVRVLRTGTHFVADSVVLTNEVLDRELSWADRWTPRGSDVWLTRSDVWRAIGRTGTPPAFETQSFINASLVPNGSGGVWTIAIAPRPELPAADAPAWWGLEPNARREAFTTYLVHHSMDGTVTGFTEVPETHPVFLDHQHFVSPRVEDDSGLITLRVWRARVECDPG